MLGGDDRNNIDIERREYLETVVSTGLGYTGLKVLKSATGLESYELGVAPWEMDEEFFEHLYSNYADEQVDKIGEKGETLLFDLRYVQGERMPREGIARIETVLDDAGLNAVLLEREEDLPLDVYLDYGFVDEELLSEEGLWGRETEDVMKEKAVQLYFVPGKPDRPHAQDLKTFDDDQNPLWVEGLTTQSRFPRSALAFNEPYRVEGAVHELGHTLGLKHSEDEENIMYDEISEETELRFDEQQKQKIKSNV